MNEVALEGIDNHQHHHHHHRKANNTARLTKFGFVTTTARTTSSPTLTDSSEEFDSSMDDNVDQRHMDENSNHDDDDESPFMTEQASGIETSEGPLPPPTTTKTTTTQQAVSYATTTQPKRSMCRRNDHVEEVSSLPNAEHSNAVNAQESFLVPPPPPPQSLEESTTTTTATTTIQVTLPPTLSSSSTSLPPKSRVGFTHVTIRDYPRSIGDNPASTSGPSISIGWKHEAECTISLDEFEENRAPRRLGREMIIPAQIREDLLRQEGYSRAEIMQCMKELNIIRGQRRRTYETLHLQSLQLLSERISRKAWNVLTLGEYKRKEQATYQELTRRSERAVTTTKTATVSSTTTTCPGDDESSSSSSVIE